MKIGIFTNNYLPNPFGVSMSIESFREEFERLGHTVYIFAPFCKGHRDENPNVFRYPSVDFNYKISFPLAIPFSGRIDKILENLELDVIHSQHPNLLGNAAFRWAKKKKIPIVFTWHTLYDKYAHFIPLVPKKYAANWMIQSAVKYANKCDQVVIPTESVGKIIKSWGVSNGNCNVIPTGINESLLEGSDSSRIRKKYQIKDDEILLLIITRLTQEKNIEFLLRAVAIVLKSDRKVKFMLGGGGYLSEKLKSYCEKEGISDQVFFPGVIPNESKKDYYAAADIFVFSSTSETQGMVLSEAMFFGLPIVAVGATGTLDAIGNNETGFITEENEQEFAEAVKKLAADPQLRKQMGERARIVAKNTYINSITAKKMLEVYQKAISGKQT